MSKEQLIKSRKRVKDFAEVYTPSWIAKDMITLTDAHIPSRTILEPSCGNGAFLFEVLSQKLERSRNVEDAWTSLRSLYGIDIQEDNVIECRDRLCSLFLSKYPNEDKSEILETLTFNIVCGDFLTKRKYQNGQPTCEIIDFLDDEPRLF